MLPENVEKPPRVVFQLTHGEGGDRSRFILHGLQFRKDVPPCYESLRRE